jgi:hypothetical protein
MLSPERCEAHASVALAMGRELTDGDHAIGAHGLARDRTFLRAIGKFYPAVGWELCGHEPIGRRDHQEFFSLCSVVVTRLAP